MTPVKEMEEGKRVHFCLQFEEGGHTSLEEWRSTRRSISHGTDVPVTEAEGAITPPISLPLFGQVENVGGESILVHLMKSILFSNKYPNKCIHCIELS